MGGIPVDDRFWDGTRWSVSLADAGIGAPSALTLHVLPLSPDSTIALPAAAAARLSAATAPIVALDAVTVRLRGAWTEVPA
ncbi:hypothetical protein [uncultured Microbacterium sp.]|uniref:Uncharacterized protein n=1 Tax=uncultured Microbacterium sp. TaxID=191216 RepID=A0A1Y5P0T6_9MICO|nr:hypothetical protein [uncultured Microbacterium sp.]SBS72266.1 hypothetical protein MIPYR_20507 [uncultured Microbacterium sp.]